MEMKLYYDGAIEGMDQKGIRMTEEFISACEYVVMGTTQPGGGVRLSIISNIPGQQLGELYYATGMDSIKVRNLLQNPECEIIMTNGMGQVALGGKVEFVTDLSVKKEKWQPWMEGHINSYEDKNYALLRFQSSYIRVMLL